MPVTGKTGADAIFKSVQHICHVLVAYRAKFEAVIDQAATADAITADQATAIKNFLTVVNALCVALEALAAFSGF